MVENARILLVDPNDARRRKLAQRVRELGAAAVDEAADLAAALKAAQAAVPELALIDACIPEDGAVALIQRILADSHLNTITPLLLVPAAQADALEDTLDRAVAAGATDWLLQPVSSALLRVQLENALAVRRRTLEQRELLKREKLLNDVATARRFQLDFLPKDMPRPHGWDLGASLQPAREVAGDFYDVFPLTQGRRIGLVIADICDKGVGAALFMALIRSMTRAFAQQNHNMDLTDLLTLDTPSPLAGRGRGVSSVGVNALKAAVSLTNNYIVDNHADLNMFATMFFGILDPRTGVLDYINGGHNPPYIVAADGTLKATLKPTGPAVGMMPGSDFGVQHAQLEPGDILITYTDGVPDARDPHSNRYGDARFRSLLTQPVSSAQEALERVQHALRNHIADADQFDDITLLFVRRNLD